jgi:hypothetical protein
MLTDSLENAIIRWWRDSIHFAYYYQNSSVGALDFIDSSTLILESFIFNELLIVIRYRLSIVQKFLQNKKKNT